MRTVVQIRRDRCAVHGRWSIRLGFRFSNHADDRTSRYSTSSIYVVFARIAIPSHLKHHQRHDLLSVRPFPCTAYNPLIASLLVGIGCGFSTVTVPLYLTELAPSLRNNLGILNQLAMVLGLIFAQSLSLLFSRQFAWRYVLAIATAFSACLLALSFFVADVKPEESKSATGDEERPLLGEAVLAEREREREHMSIGMVFTSDKKEIRRGCESDLAYWSDTSGLICSTRHYRHPDCSADLRYLPRCLLQHEHPSTRLSGECCPSSHVDPPHQVPSLLDDNSGFARTPLCSPSDKPADLQRTGSRNLLIFCKAAEATSLFGLALGLNLDLPAVSAVCLIGFILAFGLGTGPVTWVVLSEVLPPGARTAGGSVGVSLNAVTSFVVSSTFLPLQEWLEGDRGADGERSGEGNVFFVFAAFCVASLIAVRWSYGSYERAVLESVRS